MKKKLFITGGHITPALALIEQINSGQKPWDIVIVGRKYAIEGSRTVSEEYRIIKEKNIEFLSLSAGRLSRHWSLWTLVSWIKIPIGFVQAIMLCATRRPDVIVSFGGYVGLPVVVAGWIVGIPSIVHEQTMVSGVANRIGAWFAKRICVTFPTTVDHFPKHKVALTGLPIRSEVLRPPKTVSYLKLTPNTPVLYITGGATGAVSLNTLMFPIVKKLTESFVVIHQTGRISAREAERVKNALPRAVQTRYIIQPYFDTPDHAWNMQKAGLLIGRSGANTVMETAVLGKIALFIPLPWSAGGEQMKQALWLARAGSAKTLDQKDLTSDQLFAAITRMFANRSIHEAAAKRLSEEIPTDGALRLVSEIESLI